MKPRHDEATIGPVGADPPAGRLPLPTSFCVENEGISEVSAYGLYNRYEGTGLLDIDVRNLGLKTESTGDYRSSGTTLSHGIFGQHTGNGDIDIDVLGGFIDTKGTFSYGIYGTHEGDGNIAIDTGGGNAFTTTGDNGHGIVAYHFGTEDSRAIDITVGGTVEASDAGAQGVRVGIVNADGDAERVAAVGADGYRQQTVTVNNRVYGGSGEGAGVFLAGGGRIYIGSAGTVGADSCIAILASGGAPKLYLDMNLDGRKVAEVIGDDWIINDDGETTIVVNSVMLHDGATGSTGLVAANGAWDVMVRDEGVTVDTSTTPWTISAPTADVVVDRDFSGVDFDESENGDPDPEPEPEPEPDDNGPGFMEMYAPRAALYEVLPDFLLRLSDPGPSRERPSLPVWFAISRGSGAYQAARSTVGTAYDFDRFEAEAGLNVTFAEEAGAWFSARYLNGSADVSAATGGGAIMAKGLGPALGVYWGGANSFYADAGYALTVYDVDLSSDTRGLLKAGGAGYGQSVDVELGRNIALRESVNLTPRAWAVGSRVSVDDFTDAVNSRVSFPDADRLMGGVGTVVEAART